MLLLRSGTLFSLSSSSLRKSSSPGQVWASVFFLSGAALLVSYLATTRFACRSVVPRKISR